MFVQRLSLRPAHFRQPKICRFSVTKNERSLALVTKKMDPMLPRRWAMNLSLAPYEKTESTLGVKLSVKIPAQSSFVIVADFDQRSLNTGFKIAEFKSKKSKVAIKRSDKACSLFTKTYLS